jgi:hypothetical protein
MVVPGVRGPTSRDTETGADDVLCSKNNKLNPEPRTEDCESVTVGAGVEEVVFFDPEVGYR